jgi:TRAP-type mannitol/chloroaromatic compound transport system substrate-binding protein
MQSMLTFIRKTFWILPLVLVVAVVIGLVARDSGAQQSFTLKMQAAWPSGSLLYHNFQQWAKRVEQLSGGRLKIETLPSGAVVPPFEILDAVHGGVLDGAHSWGGYWVGKNRAAILTTGGPAGPFGMDFWDYIGWVHHGDGLKLINEFYQKDLRSDIVWFPVLPAGPQSFGWFKKEIKSLADVKGVKYRIPGIAGEIYSRLGMSVVTLPGAEIVPAGERGVIEAAEWVGPAEDIAMGFHDIWKFHYGGAYHESVTVGDVIFNRAVFNKLPADLQAIIQVAATETLFTWWNWFQAEQARAMRELETKHKVTFGIMPNDIQEASLKAWHDIAEREYKQNPAFKRMLDSQIEWASRVVPARRTLSPDYNATADRYWGPGGFMEKSPFEAKWKAPEWWRTER